MSSLFSVLQTTLSTGAVVGIVVGSTILFITGVVAGALLFYCISKHWCKNFKHEKSSHRQQQPGLLYEMVRATGAVGKVDMRNNVACEPVRTNRVQSK